MQLRSNFIKPPGEDGQLGEREEREASAAGTDSHRAAELSEDSHLVLPLDDDDRH